MATYPLLFQFDLNKDQSGLQLQLLNTVQSGTPGTLDLKIIFPNGGIFRSRTEEVPAAGPADVSGSEVFSAISITSEDINALTIEEGQFQKPDETFSLIAEEDYEDGIYEVNAGFSISSPADTYRSTRYFLIAHQTKALLLEKLQEIHKTYPQIPYSVMYSGTEKRAIRSFMLLEAAAIQLERGNVAAAKEMMETVIRYSKTWLTS